MGSEADKVFCEHLGLAYRVALAATGSPAEAEDTVQDAYLRFVRGWAAFDRSRPAQPYLARVVINTAAHLGRAELRRAAREEARAREDVMSAVETPSVSAEELAALRSAVAALPAGERLAVSLHYLEGLTIDDTAAALAVPRTTAANHVKRGLDELKKVLTQAGFGAAAAPAILAALPRPEAPAGLAAAVAKLTAGKAAAGGTGSAAASAALKGGLIVKVGLGVAAAGLAAGMAFWAVGGRAEDKPAPAAPIERKDPAPDQAYRVEPVPCGTTSVGYTVDDAARLYWVDSATPTVWRYDPEKRRSTLLSGSAFGVLDGPLDRARFGGWSYNQPSGLQVSGDGGSVFVRERSGQWRLLDLKTGMVKTLPPWQERNGAHNVIARDKSGEMFIFKTSGEDPAETPGCKKLKVAQFKNPPHGHYIGYMDGYALDVEKMRFYWHARGDVVYCDLRTGEIINLNPGPKRPRSTTGDVKSWTPYCPAGLSMSPTGRFIYVGGGDDGTCWRFDLEKDLCDALAWDPATGTLAFCNKGAYGKDWKPFPANLTFWPNVAIFAPDGSAYWAAQGCMRLTPVK
jgi:RNA polymerase sigma-70 factor (ECF subfamily)